MGAADGPSSLYTLFMPEVVELVAQFMSDDSVNVLLPTASFLAELRRIIVLVVLDRTFCRNSLRFVFKAWEDAACIGMPGLVTSSDEDSPPRTSLLLRWFTGPI